MTTFVLVHGAWHGGWCWRRVADLLVARGHRVFTPTLTGLGERSHLLGPTVGLDTHIADVVNVIKWERLADVVLVGHSYAGFVVSGVVEQVLPQIGALVFLDAFMPDDGTTGLDVTSQGVRDAIAAAPQTGEITLKPYAAAALGVPAVDCPWVDSLCTPHPMKTYTDRLVLTGARERVARKTYVRARGFASTAFDAAVAKVAADPTWRVLDLACGHDAMVADPEGVAGLLLEA
ncbi:MAG: alpha/beta fold hydrolase [Rhodoplanes sp.]|uniref:alpha/beta fold hydrolase n=1 Tax=Rhodoplanes sp. TaxID=1968906 RepID=UPI001844CD75|nr:alpha/beta fold hydrolase [Rhodoplanes sp.]NVO16449.1 alpha/beta fold hydrolase [Rhodoplanes sp.]